MNLEVIANKGAFSIVLKTSVDSSGVARLTPVAVVGTVTAAWAESGISELTQVASGRVAISEDMYVDDDPPAIIFVIRLCK